VPILVEPNVHKGGRRYRQCPCGRMGKPWRRCYPACNGSCPLPSFQVFYDGDSEKAWRTVCVVPAVVAFATGVTIYFISDDAPKGNYGELKKNGTMAEVSAAASFRSGACNFNTWILFLQYACCFGVELTMNNAAALYFKDEFGQTTESAAAIASIFGWMNLFARGLGGFFSDKASAKMGMRGRLWVQTILLGAEGGLVFVFANSGTLGGSIAVMIFFSLFVQAAEGSTYGIVPYVNPAATGSIAGIVGAGGNTGAVGFGLGFRQLGYKDAFIIMGATILGSSALSVFINIKGYSSLLWGVDAPVATKTPAILSVPEPDTEVAAEVNKEEDA
jgi:NNP family nitrate/nitrite transporter-like MFS transporter